MKTVWRFSIALVVTALVVALMVMLSGITRDRRHLVTCNGIDIRILDSTRLNFIGKDDVKKCLEESYGVWNGQRLDSVNLRKIETVLRPQRHPDQRGLDDRRRHPAHRRDPAGTDRPVPRAGRRLLQR